MQAQEKKETRETSDIQKQREAKRGSAVVRPAGKRPSYVFRTVIALLLLAGNFLIAAIYFHVLNI